MASDVAWPPNGANALQVRQYDAVALVCGRVAKLCQPTIRELNVNFTSPS